MLVSRGAEEFPPSLKGVSPNMKRSESPSLRNIVTISVKGVMEGKEDGSKKRLLDKSVDKSVNNSVEESVNKSVDKSVNNSVDESVDKSVDKSVNKSIDKSVDKSVNKSVDQSKDEWKDQSVASSTDLSLTSPIDPSVHSSTPLPTNQPSNQLTSPLTPIRLRISLPHPPSPPTIRLTLPPRGYALFTAITTHSFCPSHIPPLDPPLRAQRLRNCPSLQHLIARDTSLSPNYFSRGNLNEGCFFFLEASSLRQWRNWLNDPSQPPLPLRFPSLCKHGGCAIPGFLRHFVTGATSVPCEVGLYEECDAGNAREKRVGNGR